MRWSRRRFRMLSFESDETIMFYRPMFVGVRYGTIPVMLVTCYGIVQLLLMQFMSIAYSFWSLCCVVQG